MKPNEALDLYDKGVISQPEYHRFLLDAGAMSQEEFDALNPSPDNGVMPAVGEALRRTFLPQPAGPDLADTAKAAAMQVPGTSQGGPGTFGLAPDQALAGLKAVEQKVIPTEKIRSTMGDIVAGGFDAMAQAPMGFSPTGMPMVPQGLPTKQEQAKLEAPSEVDRALAKNLTVEGSRMVPMAPTEFLEFAVFGKLLEGATRAGIFGASRLAPISTLKGLSTDILSGAQGKQFDAAYKSAMGRAEQMAAAKMPDAAPAEIKKAASDFVDLYAKVKIDRAMGFRGIKGQAPDMAITPFTGSGAADGTAAPGAFSGLPGEISGPRPEGPAPAGPMAPGPAAGPNYGPVALPGEIRTDISPNTALSLMKIAETDPVAAVRQAVAVGSWPKLDAFLQAQAVAMPDPMVLGGALRAALSDALAPVLPAAPAPGGPLAEHLDPILEAEAAIEAQYQVAAEQQQADEIRSTEADKALETTAPSGKKPYEMSFEEFLRSVREDSEIPAAEQPSVDEAQAMYDEMKADAKALGKPEPAPVEDAAPGEAVSAAPALSSGHPATMTAAEFIKRFPDAPARAHYDLVKRAYAAGHEVPEAVLKDYPQVAAEVQKEWEVAADRRDGVQDPGEALHQMIVRRGYINKADYEKHWGGELSAEMVRRYVRKEGGLTISNLAEKANEAGILPAYDENSVFEMIRATERGDKFAPTSLMAKGKKYAPARDNTAARKVLDDKSGSWLPDEWSPAQLKEAGFGAEAIGFGSRAQVWGIKVAGKFEPVIAMHDSDMGIDGFSVAEKFRKRGIAEEFMRRETTGWLGRAKVADANDAMKRVLSRVGVVSEPEHGITIVKPFPKDFKSAAPDYNPDSAPVVVDYSELDVLPVDNIDRPVYAQHNLDLEKLRLAVNAGGFVHPSIAIKKWDNSANDRSPFFFKDFGKISVFFKPDAVDPGDALNPTFATDAFTPRAPRTEYRLKKEAADIAASKLSALSREINGPSGRHWDIFGANKPQDALKQLGSVSPAFLRDPYSALANDLTVVLPHYFLMKRGLDKDLMGGGLYWEQVNYLSRLSKRVDEVFGGSEPIYSVAYKSENPRYVFERRRILEHPNGRWVLSGKKPATDPFVLESELTSIYAVWDTAGDTPANETGTPVLILGQVDDASVAVSRLRGAALDGGIDLSKWGIELKAADRHGLLAEYNDFVKATIGDIYVDGRPMIFEPKDNLPGDDVYKPGGDLKNSVSLWNKENVAFREISSSFETLPQELRIALRGTIDSVQALKARYDKLDFSDSVENAYIRKSGETAERIMRKIAHTFVEFDPNGEGADMGRAIAHAKETGARDALGKVLVDAARVFAKDPSFSAFEKSILDNKHLPELGYMYDADQKMQAAFRELFDKDIAPWFNDVINAPSEYFEIKSSQLMSFDRVTTMVVPEHQVLIVKNLLKHYPHIAIYGYDPDSLYQRRIAVLAAARPNLFASQAEYKPDAVGALGPREEKWIKTTEDFDASDYTREDGQIRVFRNPDLSDREAMRRSMFRWYREFFGVSMPANAAERTASIRALRSESGDIWAWPAWAATHDAVYNALTKEGVKISGMKEQGGLLHAGFYLQSDAAPYNPTAENYFGIPGFYSKMARTLEEKMGPRATVEQVRAIIRNEKVRAEEIEWSHIGEYLDAAANVGKVEKAALLDFLKGKAIRVTEHVRGGASSLYQVKESSEDGTFYIERGGVVVESGYETEDAARLDADEMAFDDEQAKHHVVSLGDDGVAPTKYEQYSLPGAERYFEVTVTLPDDFHRNPAITTAERKRLKQLQDQILEEGADRVSNEVMDEHNALVDKREASGVVQFTSNHWPEANVIVHFRFSFRTINGKVYLFIEEIQSDWHQKGRDKGYIAVLPKYTVSRDAAGEWVIHTPDGDFAGKLNKNLSEAEANEIVSAQYRTPHDVVPNAPLKNTWPEFAVKRILMWAAENGAQGVLSISGSESAKRYSLSKQVSSITWEKGEFDKNVQVSFKSINNPLMRLSVGEDGKVRSVDFHYNEANGKHLSDVIGKDHAKRILAEDKGQITGQGLDIGGDGMKAFYDQMIPSILGKIGKKYGVAVGKMAMPTEKVYRDPRFDLPSDVIDGFLDQAGQEARRKGIEDETDDYMEFVEGRARELAEKWAADPANKKVQTVEVHAMDFPDAMRESIQKSGLSFFAPQEAYTDPFVGAKPVRARLVSMLTEQGIPEARLLGVSKAGLKAAIKHLRGLSPADMSAQEFNDGMVVVRFPAGALPTAEGMFNRSANLPFVDRYLQGDTLVAIPRVFTNVGRGGGGRERVLSVAGLQFTAANMVTVGKGDLQRGIPALFGVASKEVKAVPPGLTNEVLDERSLRLAPAGVVKKTEEAAFPLGFGDAVKQVLGAVKQVRPEGAFHDLRLEKVADMLDRHFEKQGNEFLRYKGVAVNNIQDLAEISALARHPLFEHMSVILVKDGKVVSSYITTSGNVGSVGFDYGQLEKAIADSGADGVFMAHNHPSGLIRHSSADLMAFYGLKRNLGDKLIGVIIHDHIKFRLLQDDPAHPYRDVNYKSEKPNFRVGAKDYNEVFRGLQDLYTGSGYGVIFLDSALSLMSFDHVPLEAGVSGLKAYIAANGKRYGSDRYIIVGNDEAVNSLPAGIYEGFQDVLLLRDNGLYRSAYRGELPGVIMISKSPDAEEGVVNVYADKATGSQQPPLPGFKAAGADYEPGLTVKFKKAVEKMGLKAGMNLTTRVPIKDATLKGGRIVSGVVVKVFGVDPDNRMVLIERGGQYISAPLDAFVEGKKALDGLQERRFIGNVKGAEKVDASIKAGISSVYDSISNEETLAEANGIIKENYARAIEMAFASGAPDRISNTVAMRLIDMYQAAGDFENAKRLIEHTAQRNTAIGQTIQALAMYRRLTPEGVLKYAIKVIKEAQAEGGFGKLLQELGKLQDEKAREAFAKKHKIPYLTDAAAKDLYDAAIALKDMPEGPDKDFATAKMLGQIADLTSKDFWEKVSGLQILAQLLNPKTVIRNILGNSIFMIFENFSQAVGVPLDMLVSRFTGERTVLLPSFKTQAAGFVEGAKQGAKEALSGVEVRQIHDKFDLPRGSTFEGPVLRSLEKVLNLFLKAPDKAAYQAAFADSLRAEMALAKVEQATPEMVQRAHLDGLYRTFNDPNALRAGFTKIKSGLNHISSFVTGTEKWGVGDIVLKYPGTPASILSRGIEYSPFAFVQVIYTLARPLWKPGFNQREWVRATSRALVGSSLLVGTGILLALLGLLRGRRQEEGKVADVEELTGLSDYQLNVTGILRFASSGLDPAQAAPQAGDLWVTYDWAQPASINIAMGANIALRRDSSGVIKLADSMIDASQTLVDQPLLQGAARMTQYGVVPGIKETLKSAPASFVPTLLNQTRQLVDNTARNTKAPNFFKESANRVISKIPGASRSLPPRVDVLGRPKEMFKDGSNNPFNVFLNPSFSSRYKPDPIAKMVLDIWAKTGETSHMPRRAPTHIIDRGVRYDLDAETQALYQMYIGQRVNVLFSELARNPDFAQFPPDRKAKRLNDLLTDINKDARRTVLGVK